MLLVLFPGLVPNPGKDGMTPSSRNVCFEINRRITGCECPRDLCELIEARLAEFNHVNCATAFKNVLESRRDGVPRGVVERALQALEESALQNMDAFEPRQLASTLHAMAKFRYRPFNPRFLEALEQQTFAVAGTFNALNVANTLWAYATMGRQPGEGLMRVLEGRAEAMAGTFHAQNVANTLWAYATMGREPGAGLMRVLEGRAGALAGTFNTQEIARAHV